ncbi:MAG: tetratricopeptide repeat protein [Candidatus Omnitrophota bacterium]|nr:tetratricopeptide repeat protein [Candidatus Omnitrophota bacterium]
MQRIKKSNRLCLITVILSFSLLAPTQISAADSPTLEKGISLYKQENFDEALPILKKAKEEDPNSSLAAYYLGITCKQLQNYKEAKTQLIDALSLTPKIKEALLELVEVLYQLGELNEAKSYIEVAEKENIKPPQIAFLKGLVLLKNGENLDAITAFERAKELDNTLTQAAEYQIGLANLKEKRFREAKKAFKDIIVLDPNSDLAQLSNEYMEALNRKEKAERPFRATLNVSGQYDTNVLLKPGDDTLATGITNESDWREVITFMGQYRQKVAERLVIEPQYSMYLSHQNKIGAYDVLSHTVSVTPNYYLDKATLGVATSYNYTDVGREKYLTTISVSPLANLIVGKNHMFQGNFKYQDKDYARTPTIADEDRNSDDYSGGLGYFFFFAENKGFLGLHYGINKEDTEGINWEYLGNRFTASVLYPFLEKFKLSLAGDAFLQNFDNSNTIFNVKRHDKVLTASSMLAYNFWKAAELQFRYTYVKDHSNIAIYDYDRSIYSLGVEYKF